MPFTSRMPKARRHLIGGRDFARSMSDQPPCFTAAIAPVEDTAPGI
jgi:hypothetical protein